MEETGTKPARDWKTWLTAARVKAISLTGLVLLCVTAGFAGGWLGASSRDHEADLDTAAQQRIVSSESELISDIAQRVGEGVVSINVRAETSYVDFYGLTRSYEEEGAGTGFIISSDGTIVTNRHVVPADATNISVILADGTEFEDVEVIGRTSEGDSLDIAVLKIRDTGGKELKPVTLGDSAEVNVGDKVIAIGNALGQFQNTVTQGIISGYGRSVVASDDEGSDTLQNLFQTDASINPGNSGGPLVNMNGEVIGINTAIAGDAENIGFSIPINDAKGLITTVLDTGRFERPYLGVRYLSLTDDYATELGLSVKRGAYIVEDRDGEPSILPGSPAEAAGLKAEDVITHINNEAINERNSLSSLIGRYKVGEEVTLKVHRDGQDIEVKVTLAAQE